MRRWMLAVSVVVLVAGGLTVPEAQMKAPALRGVSGWVPQGIDAGGDWSTAVAINNRGQVVALADYYTVFLWERGTARDLGAYSECRGSGRWLNDRGQVVGGRLPEGARSCVAFLWERGTIRDLGALPGSAGDSVAFDVNERGQVVGQSGSRAFLWERGRTLPLVAPSGTPSVAAAINERGEIVGSVGRRAVVWRAGRRITLPTLAGASMALDINERGQAVGWTTGRDGRRHGALWENGRIRDLGTRFNSPRAINDNGVIAGACGFAQSAPESSHACVLAGGRLTDLDKGIPKTGYVKGSEAVDLNNNGQIVGNELEVTDSDKYMTIPVLWTKRG